MYQFSDSDTTDSDDGIRFKTATTRDKPKSITGERHVRMRSRSRSRDRNERRRRSKSKSPRRSSNACKSLSRRSPAIVNQGSRSKSRERSKKRSISPIRFDASPRRSHKTARKRSRSKERKAKPSEKIDLVQATISLDSFSDDSDICAPQKVDKFREKRLSKDVESGSNAFCGPELPKILQKCETKERDHSEDEKEVCGPLLPPHLQKSAYKIIDTSSKSNSDDACGPALSPNLEKSRTLVINDGNEDVSGPSLPPHVQTCSKTMETSLECKSGDICGPALPPHLKKANSEVCGPALPPHLLKTKPTPSEIKEERSIGPFIPEHIRKQLEERSEEPINENMDVSEDYEDVAEDLNEEEEDCYGPLPPELQKQTKAHVALEERALQIKLDQLTPQTSNEPIREEWMLELPTVQAANLGLGPRQFRAKAGPDMSDRSSWTDTPGTKKEKKVEKVDLQKETEMMAMRKRDEEQEAMVRKAKKKNKRNKSLMQQHQDKLSAKKKEQGGPIVRRPFNRDTDLKVNQFDDAQKKAIMKKAQLLDDRFSHGQTKYL